MIDYIKIADIPLKCCICDEKNDLFLTAFTGENQIRGFMFLCINCKETQKIFVDIKHSEEVVKQ